MSNSKKIYFVLLILTAVSCKKFSHETDAFNSSSCKACSYADALTGHYEGVLSGVDNPFFSNNTNGVMHVELEHLFLNNGAYIDSTIMFMKLTAIMPALQDTSVKIVTFEELTGQVTSGNLQELTLNPDSIHIYRTFMGHTGGQIIRTKYTGIRQ